MFLCSSSGKLEIHSRILDRALVLGFYPLISIGIDNLGYVHIAYTTLSRFPLSIVISQLFDVNM